MKTTTEITVRNYHLDQYGHVNHARYLEFLEEGRWHYLEKNNLLKLFLNSGPPHVVAKIILQYRKTTRFGDILRVETEIDRRSAKSFDVCQNIFIKASGSLALEARVTNVFVDQKGRALEIGSDILDIWPDLAAAAGPEYA